MLELLILAGFVLPVSVQVKIEPPPVIEVVDNQLTIEVVKKELTMNEKIDFYGEKYKVSTSTMHKIINCESHYDTKIQSGYYANGVREKSFGLVQINLPSHADITYEQAIDPDFSLNFLAENLSKGKGNMWSCFKIINSATKM